MSREAVYLHRDLGLLRFGHNDRQLLVSECLKSLARKPDARKGRGRFDEQGVETKRMAGYSDTGNRKGRTPLWPAFTPPRHSSTPHGMKVPV